MINSSSDVAKSLLHRVGSFGKLWENRCINLTKISEQPIMLGCSLFLYIIKKDEKGPYNSISKWLNFVPLQFCDIFFNDF